MQLKLKLKSGCKFPQKIGSLEFNSLSLSVYRHIFLLTNFINAKVCISLKVVW